MGKHIDKPQTAPVVVCICGGESKVRDSRPLAAYVRRRRECLACGSRWTTYETLIEPAPEINLVALQRFRELHMAAIQEIDKALACVRYKVDRQMKEE